MLDIKEGCVKEGCIKEGCKVSGFLMVTLSSLSNHGTAWLQTAHPVNNKCQVLIKQYNVSQTLAAKV